MRSKALTPPLSQPSLALALLGGMALLLIAPYRVQALQIPSPPLKIAIFAERLTWRIGEEAFLQFVLQDAVNKPVRALKDMVLSIEVMSSTRGLRQFSLRIGAGAASGEMRLRLDAPGVVRISARHPELREGGIILSVKPPSPGAGASPPPGTAAGPPGTPTPASSGAPTNHTTRGKLILSRAPESVLANGKDSATIAAILDSDGPATADADVRVFLEASRGHLDPKVLIIPKGEGIGTSTLTSQQPGKVHVRFLAARPSAQLEAGQGLLEIDFDAAIVRMEARASPPKITLVDIGEIVVTLLGIDGAPVQTDKPRAISFTINSGSGEIESTELEIGAGSFQTRGRFLPTRVGSAAIAVSSPNLPIPPMVDVQIGWPWVHFVLSTLGGLMGGLLAFWVAQGRKWWRILAGLVTGPLLYWALLFGIVNLISRWIAANPLGAIFLSVVGGFLGTQVFSLLLRKLGIDVGRSP